MIAKFSKFDIKNIRRKTSEASMPSITRTVLQSVYKKPRQKILMQLASFTFASFVLVIILQAGLYLSSAKSASGEILGAATSAYADLSQAGKNLGDQNLTSAQQLFE